MLGNRFSLTKKVSIVALGTITITLLTSWARAMPSQALSKYPPINNGAYPPFSKVCTPLEIDQFIKEFLRDMNTPNESEGDEYTDDGIPGLVTCGEKAVPALVKLLEEEEDEEILISVVLGLGEFASEAAAATPALIKLLEHSNPDVRSLTARAIGWVGPSAEEAIPQLRLLLQDPEPQVRSDAADALRAIGPAASIAVPDLVQGLRTTAGSSKNDFLEALIELGEDGVSALTQLLQDPDSEIQAGAARALGFTGREATPGVITALVETLDNKNDQVCASAAYALSWIINTEEVSDNFNLVQEQAILALVRTVQDDEHCRLSALEALGSIKRKEVVEPLITLLKDDDRAIQLAAMWSLRSVTFYVGQDANIATPVLIEILKGEDFELASIAAQTLGLIGPSASDAIPALISALDREEEIGNTEEFIFRSYEPLPNTATFALGKMGQRAVPQLRELLSNSEQPRQTRALVALGEIGEEAKAAVPHILPLLQSPDKKTQLLAAITLGKIGAESEAVLPILIPALREVDRAEIRTEMATALGGLGSSAASAAPDLIWVIGEGSIYSKDWAMRDSATQALSSIGLSAVPSLSKALGNESTVISARSSFALVEIGSGAIPNLIAALGDPNVEVRRRAAFVIARIGPEAIPALQTALQAEDSNIRKGAIYAIGIINQPSEDLIRSLEIILQNTNNSLDERRVAASTLVLMGQDVA